jgi:DNA-binding NarL/FixJ family response regulator
LIHQGYPPMSLGVLEKVVGRMAIADDVGESKQDLTEFKKLTLREQEILDVMIRGVSDREIATALFILDGTICSHTRNRVN